MEAGWSWLEAAEEAAVVASSLADMHLWMLSGGCRREQLTVLTSSSFSDGHAIHYGLQYHRLAGRNGLGHPPLPHTFAKDENAA